LLHTLCEHRHFVSFFNDLQSLAEHLAMPAAQYFATRGYFADYNAHLNARLSETVRARWEKLSASQHAVSRNHQNAIAELFVKLGSDTAASPSRGDFLQALWNIVDSPERATP
jgi:hypothetical protein